MRIIFNIDPKKDITRVTGNLYKSTCCKSTRFLLIRWPWSRPLKWKRKESAINRFATRSRAVSTALNQTFTALVYGQSRRNTEASGDEGKQQDHTEVAILNSTWTGNTWHLIGLNSSQWDAFAPLRAGRVLLPWRLGASISFTPRGPESSTWCAPDSVVNMP